MPIIGSRSTPELLFPNWPFTLRKGHPLSVGLLAAFVPASGGKGVIDVAHGRIGTPVNASGDLTREYMTGLDILSPRFSGDATADRVDLGSVSGDDPFAFAGATELTILSWVRRTGANGEFGRILDKSSSGNATGGYALYLDSTNYYLRFITDGAVGSQHNSASAVVPLNETTLVGYTLNGLSSGSFYIDGSPSGTDTNTINAIPNTTTNAAIGNWNHSTNRMFPGFIGPTLVYRRALSAEEHAEAYEPATRWGMFSPPKQFWFVPAAATAGGTFNGVTSPIVNTVNSPIVNGVSL